MKIPIIIHLTGSEQKFNLNFPLQFSAYADRILLSPARITFSEFMDRQLAMDHSIFHH